MSFLKYITYHTFIILLIISCISEDTIEINEPNLLVESSYTKTIVASEKSEIILDIISEYKDAEYIVKFNTNKDGATLNNIKNNETLVLKNGKNILSYDPKTISTDEHKVNLTITNSFGKTIEKEFIINIVQNSFLIDLITDKDVRFQEDESIFNFSLSSSNSSLQYQAIFPSSLPPNVIVKNVDNNETINPNDIVNLSNKKLNIKIISSEVGTHSIPIKLKANNGYEKIQIISVSVKKQSFTITNPIINKVILKDGEKTTLSFFFNSIHLQTSHQYMVLEDGIIIKNWTPMLLGTVNVTGIGSSVSGGHLITIMFKDQFNNIVDNVNFNYTQTLKPTIEISDFKFIPQSNNSSYRSVDFKITTYGGTNVVYYKITEKYINSFCFGTACLNSALVEELYTNNSSISVNDKLYSLLINPTIILTYQSFEGTIIDNIGNQNNFLIETIK